MMMMMMMMMIFPIQYPCRCEGCYYHHHRRLLPKSNRYGYHHYRHHHSGGNTEEEEEDWSPSLRDWSHRTGCESRGPVAVVVVVVRVSHHCHFFFYYLLLFATCIPLMSCTTLSSHPCNIFFYVPRCSVCVCLERTGIRVQPPHVLAARDHFSRLPIVIYLEPFPR